MPTKKQLAQERYDRILPFIEEASQHYDSSVAKGFCHWAFATIFRVGYNIQDNDIVDYTAIDGPDDFEIDGWFVEETDSDYVLHLFQSKQRDPGTTIGSKVLAPFLNAPARILNPNEIMHCRNEHTKDLHDQLMRIMRSPGRSCTINLVFATSGTLSKQARTHADESRSRTITVEVEGQPVSIEVTLKCWDLDQLYTEHQSQQVGGSGTEACDIEFQLTPDAYHQTGPGSEFPTLSMTVPVKQIIDAFALYKFKIFQLNPRGPLGNKVNKSIQATLEDETDKRRFHLLNNGITASCSSWALDVTSESCRVLAKNFQIINGCQTTYTLWDTRSVVQYDPTVFVMVKLIECPDAFAKTIAETTNRQSALRMEDFISNEMVQIRLSKEFDIMIPPWFYEIKRGEWSRILEQQDREIYREPQAGYRKFASKEVAQAVVAFAGFPGEAKDKIGDFLNKDPLSAIASEASLSYDQIYTPSVTARQLLLPALIQRYVRKQVSRDKSSQQEDWLEYARFHIVWLIGTALRDNYGQGNVHLLPTDKAAIAAGNIDTWFESIYRDAVAAIKFVREFAQGHGQYPGHREFFRTPANYRAIESSFKSFLNKQNLEQTLPVA